jgi:hypothetical protein
LDQSWLLLLLLLLLSNRAASLLCTRHRCRRMAQSRLLLLLLLADVLPDALQQVLNSHSIAQCCCIPSTRQHPPLHLTQVLISPAVQLCFVPR